MNSKVTGFFPSGFFDHQIKRDLSELEQYIMSLKEKYPTRLIFSAECGQPREWGKDLGLVAKIIPNTKRMIFAVDSKFMTMGVVAYIVELDDETIKVHQQSA